jgi:hypothetical protein
MFPKHTPGPLWANNIDFWSERSACAALGCWHKRRWPLFLVIIPLGGTVVIKTPEGVVTDHFSPISWNHLRGLGYLIHFSSDVLPRADSPLIIDFLVKDHVFRILHLFTNDTAIGASTELRSTLIKWQHSPQISGG